MFSNSELHIECFTKRAKYKESKLHNADKFIVKNMESKVGIPVNQSNPLICIFTGFPVNSYNEKEIDQFTGNRIFSVNH
jgi:hypothetical protein